MGERCSKDTNEQFTESIQMANKPTNISEYAQIH